MFPRAPFPGLSAAAMAFAVCVACSEPLSPPDPDFVGTAKYVNTHSDQPLEIGLESFEQGQPVHRIVWVYPSTHVTIRLGDQTSRQTGSVRDIVTGSTLLVKTNGIERRSDPPQYDATWVEVVLPRDPGFER